jgi:putative flippase GtrA
MVARYIAFALISTFVNLFLQFLSFKVYNGMGAIYLAMFLGTLSGLVVKYILDKKYIFFHESEGKKDDAKKFALYSFMGVFTTIIFWGVEVAFDAIYHTPEAKYIGGLIGLAIGYNLKYFLDKKFVFVDKES